MTEELRHIHIRHRLMVHVERHTLHMSQSVPFNLEPVSMTSELMAEV